MMNRSDQHSHDGGEHSELAVLELQLRAVIEAIGQGGADPLAALFIADASRATEAGLRQGDARSLRQLFAELRALAEDLPPQAKEELAERLEALGASAGPDPNELAEVLEIVRVGRVRSQADHDRLRGWYDNRSVDTDPELEEKVVEILFDFEKLSE